jgi:hypothetical protein
MKNFLFGVLILAFIGVVGYGLYDSRIPESSKITRQIETQFNAINQPLFLSDPIYRANTQHEQAFLRLRLANAYLLEGRPDFARNIYESLIFEEQERQNFDLLGRPIIRGSGNLRIEAIYYSKLASAYEKMGDRESYDKALKKVVDLEERATALQGHEERDRFNAEDRRKKALLD